MDFVGDCFRCKFLDVASIKGFLFGCVAAVDLLLTYFNTATLFKPTHTLNVFAAIAKLQMGFFVQFTKHVQQL